MSRSRRHPEPDPQAVADLNRVIAVLTNVAAGKPPDDRQDFLSLIEMFVDVARGGEFEGEKVRAASRLGVIEPHLRAAQASKNDALTAVLTLALWWSHQFERHVNLQVDSIRKSQRTGRTSAKKRKDKGINVRTRIEAWEREHDEPLSPNSRKDRIAICAAACRKSEVTVKNALYARKRERRGRRT